MCICDNCKNLKTELQENFLEWVCEFGFPSEDCNFCEKEECNITCEHFEEIEEKPLNLAKCCKCGKEIQTTETDDCNLYCIDCFLT